MRMSKQKMLILAISRFETISRKSKNRLFISFFDKKGDNLCTQNQKGFLNEIWKTIFFHDWARSLFDEANRL